MDTIDAFFKGQQARERGNSEKVFDWHKAATLIKENGFKNAIAGLKEDREWTSDVIFKDGKPVENASCYLASIWATPEIEINGKTYDCYIMQKDSPGWNAKTVWPKSAIEILEE